MSNRPTSRPSTLSGESPVRPRNSLESDTQGISAPDTQPAIEEHTEPSRKPAEEQAKNNESKAKKVGYYMLEKDLERAQRAHTTTIIHTGLRSWTAYVNEAVMAYTKQLEQQHNDSRPF